MNAKTTHTLSPAKHGVSKHRAPQHGALQHGALILGTQAHYQDAALYSHTYKKRTADIAFYIKMAKQYTKSPNKSVLELGAGNGRISLPLTKAGFAVTAVDQMLTMIEDGKRLAHKEGLSLEWRRSDITRLKLNKTFPLIIAPFNVLMHLYTRPQIERFFNVVSQHLEPKGYFVFDVLMPDCGFLNLDPLRFYKAGKVTHPITKQKYQYSERFSYDPVSQIQRVSLGFTDVSKTTHSPNVPDKITPLLHRQFFPQEMEALLHYNGFKIKRRWGDFELKPLSAESESQIYVLQK